MSSRLASADPIRYHTSWICSSRKESPAEAAVGILSTPRWAMENALDRLDSAYGGIETYLCGLGGMDQRTIESLRSRLLS